MSYHSSENIGKIATPPFSHIALDDVAFAVFQHDTLSNPS
jgi:hypothetical protein